MRSFDLVALAAFVTAASLSAPSLTAQAPQPKMGAPLNGLTAPELARFDAGKVDFAHPITIAQGLGPIFNQQSCASCHNNPVGGPGTQMVTRFGFTDGKGNFDPLATLGGSLLQAQTIAIACQEVVPSAANTTSSRATPSALGMGLVEAIPDAAIAARETSPPSANVSGRVHWVTPLEAPPGPPPPPLRAGRFGWKAQVATTLTFSGDASQNELGFSNRLVPFDNAPNGNTALLQQHDTVADPEDGPDANGQHFIDRITSFQRYLAAPPQTPRSGMAGEAIFNAVGCADCHAAQYTTSNDPTLETAIRNKVIRPYSDFLLHDMTVAADFISQGDAGTQELRTPSLWGVRNRDPLWHDGRIIGGDLTSRILGPTGVIFQHSGFGSESAPSATAFNALPQADKLKVVAFLDSLGRAEFDADGDNDRDQADLAAFRVARNGGPYTPNQPEAVFDFNQDGFVNQVDLAAFAQVYEVDCDGNNVNDLQDVLNGAADFNQNLIPDGCEFCQPSLGFAGSGTLAAAMCGDDLTTAGARGAFQVSGGPPNAFLAIAIGAASNPYLITTTEYLVPLEPLAALVLGFTTDAAGKFQFPIFGAANLPHSTWVFQAATFDGVTFDLSNALSVTVGAF